MPWMPPPINPPVALINSSCLLCCAKGSNNSPSLWTSPPVTWISLVSLSSCSSWVGVNPPATPPNPPVAFICAVINSLAVPWKSVSAFNLVA